MKLCELIEQLEELIDEVGEDAEIRLVIQPKYPLEYTIGGVCTSDDVAVGNGVTPPRKKVVWLAEGDQLGYADDEIFEQLR
jgi:hypothetical protein